ncbi:hypothetical protein FVEN_g8934 [Fusarium venenatum]|nr:hypothetical protein FVEN_g8934 [Fusarium venenatum]
MMTDMSMEQITLLRCTCYSSVVGRRREEAISGLGTEGQGCQAGESGSWIPGFGGLSPERWTRIRRDEWCDVRLGRSWTRVVRTGQGYSIADNGINRPSHLLLSMDFTW